MLFRNRDPRVAGTNCRTGCLAAWPSLLKRFNHDLLALHARGAGRRSQSGAVGRERPTRQTSRQPLRTRIDQPLHQPCRRSRRRDFRASGSGEFWEAESGAWWAWVGGVCGAVFLLSQPLAAPRLGAAVYIGITVTASAIASIALDHFGLVGFAPHPANIGRIAGAALMIAGVTLIAKF
jgi:hypothetical protein